VSTSCLNCGEPFPEDLAEAVARADRAEATIQEIRRRYEAAASVTAGLRFHQIIPEDAP
jgi:ABC-type Fe3+-hydroxamate transport system substrate-binding protein